MKRTPKKHEWLAWAGFVDGTICDMPCVDGYEVPGNQAEIFTSRKAARARYQDVRRVRITLAPSNHREV